MMIFGSAVWHIPGASTATWSMSRHASPYIRENKIIYHSAIPKYDTIVSELITRITAVDLIWKCLVTIGAENSRRLLILLLFNLMKYFNEV
jgi:hypothetical protein